MNLSDRLYACLADGEWHSGQRLANTLGVSRTAIWKAVANLRQLGLEIAASKSRGYRLCLSLPPYDSDRIQQAMTTLARSTFSQLAVEREVTSTNDICSAWLRENTTTSGSLAVLAERQTEGRGRRGRVWQSPFGCNIYLSLTWSFDQGTVGLAGLSLVIGLAVVRGLGDCGYQGIKLKWPNDIYFNAAKLGGVLIELEGDPTGLCQTVIGIGLNLQMPSSAGDAVDQPWADLSQVDRSVQPDKNKIVAALLNVLVEYISRFETAGFSPFKAEWLSYDDLYLCDVKVTLGDNNVTTGKHIGINDEGSITIETAGGKKTMSAGEVSLRGA